MFGQTILSPELLPLMLRSLFLLERSSNLLCQSSTLPSRVVGSISLSSSTAGSAGIGGIGMDSLCVASDFTSVGALLI